MSRTKLGWVAAAAVVAVIAFLAGRALHPADSSASSLDLGAVPYGVSTESLAGLSKAGFSGFTETDAEGRTVVAGKVMQVSPAAIVIEGAGGQRTTLSIAGQGAPTRLESSTRDALKVGATVIVRRGSDPDSVAAVLVVSSN